MDPYPRTCVCHKTRENEWDALLPCLHRLWCCIIFQWQREKDSMAGMECMQWSINHLHETQSVPIKDWGIWSTNPGEMCGLDVWQINFSCFSEWGEACSLCTKAEVIWFNSTNTRRLKEHAQWAAYEAGHIWSQTIVRQPEPQYPSERGWFKEDDSWKLFWTALAPIAKGCQELTKCGCKT